MMNKIKFGIIGCGRIAQRHAEHIYNIGVLTAVCDIKKKAADTLAEQYKCTPYTDIDSLLDNESEIDVISICTPNGLHAEQAIQAFNAGFHVLCEKPMATTVMDAEKMINASLKANKRLFIIKQNRFNPPVEAVKKALDDGKLGTIHNVQLSCFWNRNAA